MLGDQSWHAGNTLPACNADIAVRGKHCSSYLDMKYLLYGPISTDLSSLIICNTCISLLMKPLQTNESFRLTPSYDCRDSQLPGQSWERDHFFRAALMRVPSTLCNPNPSDMTSGCSPVTLLEKCYSGRTQHDPITVLGTKEQVSVKMPRIAGKRWTHSWKTAHWRWNLTRKEHFPNLNFFHCLKELPGCNLL